MVRRAAVAIGAKEPGGTRLAAMAKRLATDVGFEDGQRLPATATAATVICAITSIERVLRDVRVHQILEQPTR